MGMCFVYGIYHCHKMKIYCVKVIEITLKFNSGSIL